MNDQGRLSSGRRVITFLGRSAEGGGRHGLEPIGDLIPEALLAWASDCDVTAQRLRRLSSQEREREAA